MSTSRLVYFSATPLQTHVSTEGILYPFPSNFTKFAVLTEDPIPANERSARDVKQREIRSWFFVLTLSRCLKCKMFERAMHAQLADSSLVCSDDTPGRQHIAQCTIMCAIFAMFLMCCCAVRLFLWFRDYRVACPRKRKATETFGKLVFFTETVRRCYLQFKEHSTLHEESFQNG